MKKYLELFRALICELIEQRKWDKIKEPPEVELMISDAQRQRLDDHIRLTAQLSGRSEDTEWDRMVNFVMKNWKERNEK